ncbi:BrxA/BrxB family bacilliredoxin [Cytophagaceae bacterium DM2B3-1]|uniref:BrxA/BrxB family bacilliredoxin n=2 Tax=Xanthocytophaga TaxID=3078918 RepID=A0AAE3UA29_9BACT|nr:MULTISPECIES: BrxA/BrxB family bacilliredoxin [Xanthocytophaga]MDJ1473068.1 BrxA/BrxB family bacilliredoxin [Xanthocytophaga flavus]MDJ1484292.1 BrxA/BrxB family bacilliredoxin [Xanthocytophaga flavus]MDJ1495182.1 BrxA/BrxB family bacilliredoxin [Xanthocytophaga flavus]MDJ1503426.1 BrxA/BrxB family bacilliredoxin [Xanthocytophaga agilis]
MYPEPLVAPMRQDLTVAGFEELKTPEDVVNTLENQQGTLLVVVNSVCGCAAGAARPGVKLALESSSAKPDKIATVFAGVDTAATAKAREYFLPYPPSSPSIALFKDGELVHFIERHHIEGRNAKMIADHLVMAFDEFCTK